MDSASEDASVNAEEDVDDAALAASLQVAKRTSSAREALEKRRRREAQPRRAVDAPQKPTLGMRGVCSLRWSRSRSFESCSTEVWGALPSELLTRLVSRGVVSRRRGAVDRPARRAISTAFSCPWRSGRCRRSSPWGAPRWSRPDDRLATAPPNGRVERRVHAKGPRRRQTDAQARAAQTSCTSSCGGVACAPLDCSAVDGWLYTRFPPQPIVSLAHV